jgi:hypothetical protein
MEWFTTIFLCTLLLATSCQADGTNDYSTNGVPLLNKRRLESRVVHAAPSKRSPATDDAQASIVLQAIADPVGAAIAAQGLDGIKGNTQGGDLAGSTLIQGDSDSAVNVQDNQYPWNYNVTFVPNANAVAGTGLEAGWQALPQLDGFNLVRDQIMVENATQVSLMCVWLGLQPFSDSPPLSNIFSCKAILHHERLHSILNQKGCHCYAR